MTSSPPFMSSLTTLLITPHLTETISTLIIYIRMSQRHPQGTLHFHHISHIIKSFKYCLEFWSANVFAHNFLLYGEDSTSTTPEHCEPPFYVCDLHWTGQQEIA